MAERVDGLSVPPVPSAAERRAGSGTQGTVEGGVEWGGGGLVSVERWSLKGVEVDLGRKSALLIVQ